MWPIPNQLSAFLVLLFRMSVSPHCPTCKLKPRLGLPPLNTCWMDALTALVHRHQQIELSVLGEGNLVLSECCLPKQIQEHPRGTMVFLGGNWINSQISVGIRPVSSCITTAGINAPPGLSCPPQPNPALFILPGLQVSFFAPCPEVNAPESSQGLLSAPLLKFLSLKHSAP